MNKKYTLQLREMLTDLPEFVGMYFLAMQTTTSPLTRLNYAYDLRCFFEYLCECVPAFSSKTVQELKVQDLEALTPQDIDAFLEYVTVYQHGDAVLSNDACGKERKLCTLRTFLRFFCKRGFLVANPAQLVDLPRVPSKPIVRLEADEVVRLLDAIENGDQLSDGQKKYHKFTAPRDLALITLFLGTGMRVGELVGLDMGDLDFSINGVRVVRKGGNTSILYFSDEVADALHAYLLKRAELRPLPGHEAAFFLSIQRKRMGVRGVQNLVKKYTQAVLPLKTISPHKLRSTYGTMLYQETGDIYLVAAVLGHKDINTTKKHYAAMSDEQRRLAAKAVKLRKD